MTSAAVRTRRLVSLPMGLPAWSPTLSESFNQEGLEFRSVDLTQGRR